MEGSPTWQKASEKSSSETGMALRLIVLKTIATNNPNNERKLDLQSAAACKSWVDGLTPSFVGKLENMTRQDSNRPGRFAPFESTHPCREKKHRQQPPPPPPAAAAAPAPQSPPPPPLAEIPESADIHDLVQLANHTVQVKLLHGAWWAPLQMRARRCDWSPHPGTWTLKYYHWNTTSPGHPQRSPVTRRHPTARWSVQPHMLSPYWGTKAFDFTGLVLLDDHRLSVFSCHLRFQHPWLYFFGHRPLWPLQSDTQEILRQFSPLKQITMS